MARPVQPGAHCPAGVRAPSSGSDAPFGSYSYPGTPPLTNHGGPVMATPAVGDQVVLTPIYWAPAGYSFTTSYKNVINTYLADLASDSDKTSNVFGTTFQYSGSNGAINYRMTRTSALADTNSFPAAGCTTNTGSIYADGSGYNTCLDDAQLQTEIDSVLAAHGLTRDLGHMYLLFMPKGVETCFYPGNPSNQQCGINSSPSGAFCAYHSGFSGGSGPGETVYANMPFPVYESATGYSCTDEGLGGSYQIQSPNGDPDADVEISPLSHEIAEAITDPNGNAWYDSSGYENGDDCAYIYGTLSGPSGGYYNQSVNGHHYLTQEEFSNADYYAGRDGCRQDTAAVTPTVTGLSTVTGPAAGGTSLTITGTGFPGTTAVHFGSATASYTIVDATHITATAPPETAGTVDVTVSTAAGTSATGNADQYTYTSTTPAPTVTGVSPSSGSTAGGTQVTITGTDLTTVTAVTFGATAAAGFTVTDAGHITATSPAEAAGTVDVTVLTDGGPSATGNADQYTFTTPAPPKPTVSGVTPSSGSTAGGTQVTITGTDLTGATAVTFGATAAAGFTVTDAGHVTATSPAGAAGTVDVTVTTGGGTSAAGSSDHFTFTTPASSAPTVTGISPTSGPTKGGTKVTITGTDLAGANAVTFGSKAATTFIVTDAGHITATTPAGTAGTVDVRVTTPGGTSATSSTDRFHYLPRPRVTGLSQASGPKGGGTRVVITGRGFLKGAVVRFGTKVAQVVRVRSATKIVVRTPRHARGRVDVVVVTPGGASPKVRADRFRYL